METEVTLVHLILAVGAGAALSSLLACLPALHIYNVAGIFLLVTAAARETGVWPDEIVACFLMSLVVGYSIVNTIPAVFLGAPDESAIFMTLPGQKFLMCGRGREAALLTGIGGLGGLLFLAILAPFASPIFRVIRAVVGPHLFWILALILAFIVLSEWPKGGARGATPWARLWDGWKSLLAGIATLILSGFLGMILLYRPLVPLESSFQNIMPAFIGLFAVPWVLQNAFSPTSIPDQHRPFTVDCSPSVLFRGIGAGCMGGLFAAFFPVVTGGMGGLLAGHATAQRDDRIFIISQGASKLVYYVGGFLLLFVPGLHLRRGGMAIMMSGLFTPRTESEFHMIVGAILIAGALSFILLLVLTDGVLWVVRRVDYRLLSWATLAIITGLVYFVTGWQGLIVAVVSTGIGLIPVYFQSRRMNCMGVLLIPVILNMSGVGADVAAWLGLI
ncbi:MAG: tripartite tricarboxylate transporter permease [Planctomycetota bacterium]|jgi:putative membrane protein